jgi:outer membrane protein
MILLSSRLLTIFLVFFSGISCTHAKEQITFPEAVNLALASNPRMLVSQAKMDAASAGVMQSKGGFFPRIDLEAQAARSNNPANVFTYKLSQGNVTFDDFGLSNFQTLGTLNPNLDAINSPGYYNNFNTSFVLSVPIFKGGLTKAMLEKSRHLLAQAQHGNTLARNELIYDVLQSYEGVLVAEKFVNIAEQSAQAAQEYLTIAQNLFAQSLIIESDKLLAETNLRNAQTNLKAHQSEYATQLENFRLLIGKPDTDITPSAASIIPMPKDDLPVLEEKAIQHNPHLLSIKSKVESKRAQISAEHAAYWPKLGLQIRQEWNDETLGLNSPAASVFLGFDWELLNIGLRSGATKQAQAEHLSAQGELSQQALDIKMAMTQAVHQAEIALLKHETSLKNSEDSSKALSQLKKRYARGSSPLSQVLDAQSRYDTIHAQTAVADYDIRLARARILKLLNEIDHNG